LEEISDWKIFAEYYHEPLKTMWQATFSPQTAICPPLHYSIH